MGPSSASATAATARWSPRTGSSVKVRHSPRDSKSNKMFPVDGSHPRLLLANSLFEHGTVWSISALYFKKHPFLINAVEHNSHFLFRSPWFSFNLADINECSMPSKCQNGDCVNTEGSYTCECNSGYAKSWRGLCEGDMNACTSTYAHTQVHITAQR